MNEKSWQRERPLVYHSGKVDIPMPEGPWQEEPDKVQFTDDDTGLPCLIVRNHYGSLCGYVGVAEGHPWYEKGYDHVYRSDFDPDVHGGLTFADHCHEDVREELGDAFGICHIPEPGQPERVWWLGFDCGHSCDYSPGMAAFDTYAEENIPNWPKMSKPTDRTDYGFGMYNPMCYKNIEYVKDECKKLAKACSEAMMDGQPAT